MKWDVQVCLIWLGTFQCWYTSNTNYKGRFRELTWAHRLHILDFTTVRVFDAILILTWHEPPFVGNCIALSPDNWWCNIAHSVEVLQCDCTSTKLFPSRIRTEKKIVVKISPAWQNGVWSKLRQAVLVVFHFLYTVAIEIVALLKCLPFRSTLVCVQTTFLACWLNQYH